MVVDSFVSFACWAAAGPATARTMPAKASPRTTLDIRGMLPKCLGENELRMVIIKQDTRSYLSDFRRSSAGSLTCGERGLPPPAPDPVCGRRRNHAHARGGVVASVGAPGAVGARAAPRG